MNSSENILADFKLFLDNLSKVENSKLVSFSFSTEILAQLLSINALTEISDDLFLFRTPNYGINVVGLNSALIFKSDKSNKFSSTYPDYNFWKNNFINNWSEINKNIQLIFAYAKFNPNNSSKLWDEFDTIKIYIPEFILTFQNENITGFFNFIFDDIKKAESLLLKLSDFLHKLFEMSSRPVQLLKRNLPTKTKSYDTDFSNWDTISLSALSALKNREVNKLVLSRTLNLEFDCKIDWYHLLQDLGNRFPDCYLFFIKKNDSIFFGSSPEMFLKVSDKTAEVESVAGSAARGEKSESDYELEKILKTSEKNHQEHIFVSDFITNILIKYSNNVRVIEEKQIRKLDNIQHLITKISAELNSKNNLFELIDSLFPTPAVCGDPKEKAMDLIRQFELHDRGLYSGLVGLFDFNSNCELAVSIRSALVKDQKITAFAGAGFVKDSDPKEEFKETNLKLDTILSLFADEK